MAFGKLKNPRFHNLMKITQDLVKKAKSLETLASTIKKALSYIWAQIIDVYNRRFRFEIIWLLDNSSVCISKSIGARLNICINIK